MNINGVRKRSQKGYTDPRASRDVDTLLKYIAQLEEMNTELLAYKMDALHFQAIKPVLIPVVRAARLCQSKMLDMDVSGLPNAHLTVRELKALREIGDEQ